MKCFACGATVNNGLALCQLCQTQVGLIADVLPTYYRNLARWRPGKAGSRPVPGSRPPAGALDRADDDATGDRISDRLDDTLTTLHGLTQAAVTHRPYLGRLYNRLTTARAGDRIDDTQVITLLCRGLTRHLPSLTTLDWCGQLVTGLAYHEEVLRELTEELIPGWYAGACTACGAGTYALTDLTWVNCRGCGKTDHAAAHIPTILHEARGWVAPPVLLADALVALVDGEQSPRRLYDRIRQWAARGRLAPVHQIRRDYSWDEDQDRFVVTDQETGAARYRLGEVLDLLTKPTADQRKAS